MLGFSTFSLMLLGAASALPTVDKRQSSTSQQYDADFEDVPAILALPILPIGEYKDLNYEGMLATVAGALGITIGIQPHTGDQIAATGLQAELLDGEPALDINFPESNTSSFDLDSFYFACALDTVTAAAGAAQSCTLTVAGFKADGSTGPSADFQFQANSLLSQEMKHAVLPKKFVGLERVVFRTSALLTSALVSTVFDDFKYTAYLG